jgi:hypothetical protein
MPMLLKTQKCRFFDNITGFLLFLVYLKTFAAQYSVENFNIGHSTK